MSDLTLLYYSAHSLPRKVEANVRKELLKTVKNDFPIISVTQKPIKFGKNICVGKIGQSHYNCYKQIYIGALSVKTKYVAMVEDDTLYPREHFDYRPMCFGYNTNNWRLEDKVFWTKGVTYMSGCIASTESLLEVLKERFDMFPEEPMPRKSQRHFWQEPGRVDDRMGLIKPPVAYFYTKVGIISLNYYNGLDGKQKSVANKRTEKSVLPYWGEAKKLKERIWTL